MSKENLQKKNKVATIQGPHTVLVSPPTPHMRQVHSINRLFDVRRYILLSRSSHALVSVYKYDPEWLCECIYRDLFEEIRKSGWEKLETIN